MKCEMCEDTFNWEPATPSWLESLIVRTAFPDRYVHHRRWHDERPAYVVCTRRDRGADNQTVDVPLGKEVK